jgi:cytidylate kinase
MNKPYPVITISRQYGSGGRELGRQLAQTLGIPFYDYEVIAMAASGGNVAEKVFANAENQAKSRLKLTLGRIAGGEYKMSLNDQVFHTQASVIRTIADRSPAVIVGRCADYVLKDYTQTINIFIQASQEYRLQQAISRNGYTPTQAAEFLKKVDKSRATYHNFYSDNKWGQREFYDLCIDAGKVPQEVTLQILVSYVRAALGDALPPVSP